MNEKAENQQVVSGALFAIAIITASSRVFIRRRLLIQRFQIDDWLLLLACICLTSETILLFITIPHLYFVQNLGKSPSLGVSISIERILEEIKWFQRGDCAFLVVTWMAIFFVKFSFLFFFRRMIDRLRKIVIYWKVIVVANLFIFVFSVLEGFLVCPKSGLEAGEQPN